MVSCNSMPKFRDCPLFHGLCFESLNLLYRIFRFDKVVFFQSASMPVPLLFLSDRNSHFSIVMFVTAAMFNAPERYRPSAQPVFLNLQPVNNTSLQFRAHPPLKL